MVSPITTFDPSWTHTLHVGIDGKTLFDRLGMSEAWDSYKLRVDLQPQNFMEQFGMFTKLLPAACRGPHGMHPSGRVDKSFLPTVLGWYGLPATLPQIPVWSMWAFNTATGVVATPMLFLSWFKISAGTKPVTTRLQLLESPFHAIGYGNQGEFLQFRNAAIRSNIPLVLSQSQSGGLDDLKMACGISNWLIHS